jgi:hypothetical protein
LSSHVTVFTLATGLALTAAAGAPALAADAGYIGTWATDKGQCKVAQDKEGAPMVFTKDGYDQHETHCKFKSVDGTDKVFKVAAECAVEGDTQKWDFTLTVDGDKMFMESDSDGDEYIRCK